MVFQELVSDVDEENCEDLLCKDFAILNFFSDWKMGCLMCMPVIESLAEELLDKVCFGKVNIDEQENLAERYKVSKVPEMLIFQKGKLIERMDCSMPEEALRERLAAFF
jgi:thioredoxin 1